MENSWFLRDLRFLKPQRNPQIFPTFLQAWPVSPPPPLLADLGRRRRAVDGQKQRGAWGDPGAATGAAEGRWKPWVGTDGDGKTVEKYEAWQKNMDMGYMLTKTKGLLLHIIASLAFSVQIILIQSSSEVNI